MDITPLYCNCCGRNLGCEIYLGKYVKFLLVNKETPENKLAPLRKKFFIEELNLKHKCCWLSLQGYHDPVYVALQSVNYI